MIKHWILFVFSTLLVTVGCTTNKNNDRVPDWAKDAVWYQIFPERFNNGDPSNDPISKDLEGGWPYDIPDGWQIHPWTSDWYKIQPWEVNEHDFYWNAGVRRYGGDLQGVLDKLDYLKELGITALYFNPVFESPSLHKYDATFFHHVDNNFGPDPEGDRKIWESEIHSDPSTWKWTPADKLFLELIKEAHEREIRVIIDGVFNHVGNTFWAFQDVVKNQDSSKYKSWFTINSFDDPSTEFNEFSYEGWNGVRDLPEIKEDENGLVEDAAKHVHDVVKRWMDPNGDGDPSDGIDGWRLDVAEMVKHSFWKKFRTWVKDVNPNAYITGEIWWDDWQHNKMMNASPWLQGDQFDAVMNYRFTRAVKHFISDQDSSITAEGFIDTINTIRKDYNTENLYVLMNLLGSHDTERLASLVVNPDHWYDHHGNPGQRKSFLVRKPNQPERKRQMLMTGIQMTMLGAPMIYYGDEAGMWGGDDPDCRKPMVWPEYNYETETTHPFGLDRPADNVKFDQNLFDWYKNLISIRNSNIELSRGDLKFIKFSDPDILLYERTKDNNKILVAINRSDKSKEIDIPSLNEYSKNLVKNETISLQNDSIKLEPREIQILK